MNRKSQKQKPLVRLAYRVAAGIAGIFGLIALFDLGGLFLDREENILNSASLVQPLQAQYSFTMDDDADDLSNAMEMIFGSDPGISDTDGDGFVDGQEVINGYDPLISGQSRLSERFHENMTIHYFEWLREFRGPQKWQIDNKFITEFAEATSRLRIDKEPVGGLVDTSSESMRSYFDSIHSISIPEAGFGYRSIAELGQYTEATIDALIDELGVAHVDLKSMQVPREASKIHQNLLTIVSVMTQYFSDLKDIDTDPVQVRINILTSSQLVELAEEADRTTEVLRRKYSL